MIPPLYNQYRQPGTQEFRPTNEQYYELVQDAGKLLGISGLDVIVRPHGGFATIRDGSKLTISVDPYMTVSQKQANVSQFSELEPDPRFLTNHVFHELGHARDVLDGGFQGIYKGKERLFWNVLDDMVIQKRLRTIPILDQCMDEFYKEVAFPVNSLTDKPKHIQFMTAILLHGAINDHKPAIAPDVAQYLATLRTYKPDPSSNETFDVLGILAQHTTSLEQRRSLGQSIIWPLYTALYKQDVKKDTQKQQPHDGQTTESNSDQFEGDYQDYDKTMHGDMPPDTDDNNNKAGKELHETLKEASKQLKKQQGSQTTNTKQQARSDNQAHETRITDMAGKIAGEMRLSQPDAEAYMRMILLWQTAINQIARSFEKLALPTVSINSPRYKQDALYEGHRLSPIRLGLAGLQITTNKPQPIWQPIEIIAKRRLFNFGGLDVHFLVDVSGSMAGSKAIHATAVGVQLLEGIDLARRRVERKHSLTTNPDVRIEVVAFGADTATLAPLAFSSRPEDKGKVFTNLSRPDSKSTLVNNSLIHVAKNAKAHPDRQQLVLIITDGYYGDRNAAYRTLQQLPKNTITTQLTVGPGEKSEAIGIFMPVTPQALPTKIHHIIRSILP